MDVQLLEFKAKARNPTMLRQRIMGLAGVKLQNVRQEDIFFPCLTGRLKLRILGSDQGQLSHYRRADIAGTKISDCQIVITDRPHELCAVLVAAHGQRGRVIKDRLIARISGAQIHLDQVDGLGDFVEIEIPRSETPQEVQMAAGLMESLIGYLEIASDDMIAVAYIDLLERGENI